MTLKRLLYNTYKLRWTLVIVQFSSLLSWEVGAQYSQVRVPRSIVLRVEWAVDRKWMWVLFFQDTFLFSLWLSNWLLQQLSCCCPAGWSTLSRLLEACTSHTIYLWPTYWCLVLLSQQQNVSLLAPWLSHLPLVQRVLLAVIPTSLCCFHSLSMLSHSC